jgi:hypothetical protein
MIRRGVLGSAMVVSIVLGGSEQGELSGVVGRGISGDERR